VFGVAVFAQQRPAFPGGLLLRGQFVVLLLQHVPLLLAMLLAVLFFVDGLLPLLLLELFFALLVQLLQALGICWSSCRKVLAGSSRRPSRVSPGSRLANPLSLVEALRSPALALLVAQALASLLMASWAACNCCNGRRLCRLSRALWRCSSWLMLWFSCSIAGSARRCACRRPG
jgi:hypothetical protein